MPSILFHNKPLFPQLDHCHQPSHRLPCNKPTQDAQASKIFAAQASSNGLSSGRLPSVSSAGSLEAAEDGNNSSLLPAVFPKITTMPSVQTPNAPSNDGAFDVPAQQWLNEINAHASPADDLQEQAPELQYMDRAEPLQGCAAIPREIREGATTMFCTIANDYTRIAEEFIKSDCNQPDESLKLFSATVLYPAIAAIAIPVSILGGITQATCYAGQKVKEMCNSQK